MLTVDSFATVLPNTPPCLPLSQRRLVAGGAAFARALCLLVILAFVTQVAAAQEQGRIDGMVKDSTGAAVAGALVEIVVAGQTRALASDESGHYHFDGVPAGHYRLTATFTAMASVEVSVVGGVVTQDLVFSSVVVSESVSVTGIAAGGSLDRPAAAASRLGLTPRETPATINVMTFAESQERGLVTTTEALTRVPGISASNVPSTFAAGMRGFTGTAISTLFDGTRSTTSTMVMRAFDSWNFERIEVLKGPASVLYGEGALAGAINFVPKRPDFARRHSEALMALGTLGSGRGAVGTTGPIGSGRRAAYRADVVVNRNGGFIDGTPMHAANASGSVDVKLSSTSTLSLSVDHFRDNYRSAYWGTPLVGASVARAASDVVTDSRGLVLDKAMRTVNFEATDAVTRSHNTWVRARYDWRLGGGWRLLNETYAYHALREWEDYDTYGFDAARGLVTRASSAITHHHNFYGDRLVLASDTHLGSRRNRFSVGVEGNRNHFLMPRRFGTGPSVDPFSPVRGEFPALTQGNFPGAGNFVDFTTDITLLSLFAEEAFSVAPRLTLVGGIRYDHFNLARVVDDQNAGTRASFARVFEPKSGRAGIVADVAAATQVFAQFTSAVAPVSTVPIISQTNARFDLTTGQSWEAGLKSTLGGGRAEVTASVFRIGQDNILTRDPINPNLTVQGGSLSSRGLELAVSVVATPALHIDANVSVLKAQFDRLIEAGGLDRSGNAPTNVPGRSAGLWATYRFTTLPLSLSGGLRGQGQYFGNNANTLRIKSYTLIDAQGAWRVGPGQVIVRGKNLANQFFVEWALTANQVMIGAPRTFDASYQFRF